MKYFNIYNQYKIINKVYYILFFINKFLKFGMYFILTANLNSDQSDFK